MHTGLLQIKKDCLCVAFITEKTKKQWASVEARKILIRDEAKLVTSRVAESTAVDCWEITDCVIKGLVGKN